MPLGAIALIVLISAGVITLGVVADRSTSPAPTANDKCQDAIATAKKFTARAKELPNGSTEQQQQNRLTFTTILQNPDCFSAETRARAGDFLTQANR